MRSDEDVLDDCVPVFRATLKQNCRSSLKEPNSVWITMEIGHRADRSSLFDTRNTRDALDRSLARSPDIRGATHRSDLAFR